MLSLIVATRGRTLELERLLQSLGEQSFINFEVIIVDQNEHNQLAATVARHNGMAIRHLRCATGASLARNVGLRAARGDVIGFPDDDCWYPPMALKTVDEWFATHPDFDGLLGILRDADNRPTGPKWPTRGCSATALTVWRYGITGVAFLRRRATDMVGFFNENIGPGVQSNYHSGEDADYFLRGIQRGQKLWHDPSLTIHHPSFHDDTRLREKSYTYAMGGGYILRTYHFPPWVILNSFFRSLAGALVNLLHARPRRSISYFKRACGLARGYTFGPNEIKRYLSIRTVERHVYTNPRTKCHD